MHITLFSLFMSVIWSSVLVAFNFLCRKRHFFIRQFGITSLLFLYLFSIVRMMVPYEFSFTKVLASEGVFGEIFKIIHLSKIGAIQISFLVVLTVIWVIVSAMLITRFICQYFKAMKEFSAYSIREDEQCKRIFDRILNKSKKQMRLDIRCNDSINIPMGVGILRKSIILPDEDYTDLELYYILLHEYTHFQNKDLFIKMLIHIFCCIFWWNPVIYLLKKDLAQTLEIKCDLDATDNMGDGNKAEYLTTIVNMLKKISAKRSTKTFYGTAALVSKDYELETIERFKIVSDNRNHKRKSILFSVSWFLIFMMFILISYSFVIQPDYEVPVNAIGTDSGISEVTTDNSYIMKNIDGRYTLILPSGDRQDIGEEMALSMISHGFELLEGGKIK